MALKNKKLNNKEELNNQVIMDPQDANSNDTVGRMIATSFAIAGGIALYKSGALRKPAHAIKEFGANFAEMSAQGYHSSRAIKNWANGLTGEIERPSRSLFNSKKGASVGYDIWQDLRQSFADGKLYSANTRRIINDTAMDINILNDMIKKEIRGYGDTELKDFVLSIEKELDGQPDEVINKAIKERSDEWIKNKKDTLAHKNASIKEADILKDIKSLNEIKLLFNKENLTQSGNAVANDLMSSFIKKNTLTSEMAETQLKRSGYRSLTLGDIFESFDAENGEFVFKDKMNADKLFEDFNINIKETVKRDKTVLETITDFAKDSSFRYSKDPGVIPRSISSQEDIWKNLIIDKSLNIDENGKIINYMMGKDALVFFGNSLRKDFGLPVLGFNPLDSFVKIVPQLDRALNDRRTTYGLINGIGNFSPYISGVGTRTGDDISTALQKRFNNFDEDFHLLFSNSDLYALGTKGTKEYLGTGYNLYNITGADKAFKLPHNVEIMRMMGGYDLNRDFTGEVLEELGNFSKTFDPRMTVQEYEKMYNVQMSQSQKLRYEIGRRLDIGFQEFRGRTDSDYFDIGEKVNVDNLFDKVIDDITHSNFLRTNGFQFENYEEAASIIRNKTYDMAFGKTFEDFILPNGAKITPNYYVITKEGTHVSDLFKDIKSGSVEDFTKDAKAFVGQYFSGFDKNYNMGKYFNEKSSTFYDIFNALDSGLSSIGLGLSLESKHSTGALLGNLLIKRALPVYMLTQIPGMIDYFSEPIFTSKEEKEKGINDTLSKTVMRSVVKPIDIGFHGVGDTLGFTKFFKKLQELTPGYEHFNELPGIYQLGLGQSKEEREEYIEKGYDPIRKNRYWSVSNTPFTGSKIDHWRPNIYRRIEADVKFSDTMYGSRKEYYQNTWYPNLVSPLAPIRHFITDPNHWDKKHYYDRPYAETAPKGENIPLIGPLVSGTVGQIYRHKMHKEYWNEDGTLKPVNPEDEKPSKLLSTGTSSNFVQPRNNILDVIQKAFVDTSTFNEINANAQEQYKKAANQRLVDLFNAQKLTNADITDQNNSFTKYKNKYYDNANKSYTVAYDKYTGNTSAVNQYPYTESSEIEQKLFTKAKEYASPLQTSTLPYRDYDKYDTALDVYVTPSGQTQIVDVPENLNLYKVNQEIQHYSLNKIYGTNQRVDIREYDRGYQEQEPKEFSNNLSYAIGKEFNDISNIYGLKGFMIQTAFTGEANVGKTQVETSSYTYSANRSFWDENLGGLGGELSEISRRFIHKKDKNTEFLNPIRNTMPTWMPGSNYFTDFLHGDPYSKIMNGEERLPGEAYERLNNIKFSLNTSASMLGQSRSSHVKHFLYQDTNLTYEDESYIKNLKRDIYPKEIEDDKYKIQDLNQVEEFVSKVLDVFRKSDVLLDSNLKFYDQSNEISGVVDAKIKNYHSRTGESLINIRGVEHEEFNKLQSGHDIRKQDYYEMNYDMYFLNNTLGKNYVYYYDKSNPDDIYKAQVKFNKKDLRSSIQNLNDAKMDIYKGLESGEISRGDLYSLVEKYKILADTAPYSQEFKDISAQVTNAHLSDGQKREIKAAHDRMKEQKEPLRVYDYKFKTANLKSEKVTVKKVVDNNTLIVEEYGKEHAIKFAGINVSESNSTLYAPTVKEKKKINKETGREITERSGLTMEQAAYKELSRYLKPGKKITIQYDADERNKYKKDSTQSIRAIVRSNGVNVNRRLLNKGLANEKESDESPAGIRAKYSGGEIAFGSAMETLTHGASKLPFIGDKFFQIRSPYEQYRKREVYNKDFKSWNHPIRDYLIPTINETSAENPIGGIMVGAFLGSMMGRGPYGKFIGTIIGATVPTIGQAVHAIGSDKEHEWRPYRRRQQEEINTYIDMLKYVKNTRLYNQYKDLAMKKDKFDVDAYLEKQKDKGESNKQRQQELNNYKRLVKLDFKHRGNYNFKYGEPKYVEEGQSKKEVIRAINKELTEISSDRKIEKLPLNAIKAISYKQAADQTMYGFEPGDDIRNIMSALPKKERQYYSKLVNAPEEEKQKILRIAPSYLRRALQASWGMHVDEKPELKEYFTKHALPDENWTGWDESTDIEDIKVKIINANGLDPGEYDIWTDNKRKADEVNIPIPKINIRNNAHAVEARLSRILTSNGFDNVQVSYMRGIKDSNTTFNISQDTRDEVSQQINNLAI